MAKRKKQCNAGYSCGNSCIQVSKECRVEFPTGVSVSLDRKAAFRNDGQPPTGEVETDKIPRLKKDFKMADTDLKSLQDKLQPGEEFVTDSEEGIYYMVDDFEPMMGKNFEGILAANEGKLEEKAKNLLDNVWNGKVQGIGWEVEEEAEDPKGRLKQALIAKKMWEKEVLPNLEEGTLVANAPLGGPHNVRDRLYRKGGFGRVQDHGPNNSFVQYQYAMVVNGKLVPIEFGKPHIGYQKADIPDNKLETWDFASGFTKQDVAAIADEVGVELEGLEWGLYLELLNEENGREKEG